jgi:hypothetical protein
MKIFDPNYKNNIEIKNNWNWYGLLGLKRLIPEIEITQDLSKADFFWIENSPNKRVSKRKDFPVYSNKTHILNAGLEYENTQYTLPKNYIVFDCNEKNNQIDFNLCKLTSWLDGELITGDKEIKFNFGFRRPDIHRNSLEKLINNFSAYHYRCEIPEKTNDDIFLNSKYANLFQDNKTNNIFSDIAGVHNQIPKSFVNMYKQTNISIVMETNFWHDLCFDSEKVHRELACGMIPIIFGPIGIVVKLKNQGFVFPEHLWDHSYDKIIDPLKRFDFLVAQLFEIEKTSNREFDLWKKEFEIIGFQNHQTAKRNLKNDIDNLRKIFHNFR